MNIYPQARVISPQFNKKASNSTCFSFWYFMYGSGIPTLNVILMREFTQQIRYTKRGLQGRAYKNY